MGNPLKHTDFAEDGWIRDHAGKDIKQFKEDLIATTAVVQKLAGEYQKMLVKPIDANTINSYAEHNKLTKEATDLSLIYQKLKQEEARADKLIADQKKAEIQLEKEALDLQNKKQKQQQQETDAVKKSLVEKEKEKIINAQLRKDAKEAAKDQLGLTTEYDKQQRTLDKLIAKKRMMVGTDKEQSLSYKVISAGIQDLDTKLKNFDDSVGKHTRHVGAYGEEIKSLGSGLAGTTGLLAMLGKAIGVDTEEFEKLHEISKELIKVTREYTHATHLEHLAHEEHAASLAVEGAAVEAEAEAEVAANEAKSASLGIYGLMAAAIAGVIAAIYAFTKASEHEIELEKERSIAMDGTIIVSEKLRESYNEHLIAVGDLNDKYKVLNGTMSETEASMNHIRRGFLKTTAEIKNESTKQLQEATGFWKSAGDAARDYFNIITLGNARLLGMDSGSEARKKRLEKIAEERDANLKAEAVKAQDEINAEAVKDKEKEAHRKEHNKKEKDEFDKLAQDRYESSRRELDQIEQDDKASEELHKQNLKNESDWDAEYNAGKLGLSIDAYNAQKKIKDQEIEDEKKRILEEKKLMLERIAETQKMIEQITSGIRAGLDKRAQLQQQSDQQEINMHQRMIDVQAKIAAEGRANNLAEVEAQTEKAEEKKIQDAKKAAKLQQNIAIVETFEKTLTKALESNKSFPQAFAEALASSGLVSAVFTQLFAGFATGVEDLDGPGTETSDSIPVRLSKGESVATAKATRENPGLVTAMNAGNVDEYFEKIYRPNYISSSSSDGIAFTQAHDERLASIIDLKLTSLQKAIESKPVQTTRLNGLGSWTEEIQKQNMKIITHHFERQGGKPSLRLNG